MPELPEVETTRRHLVPVLVGRRIVEAEVRRPRMVRRQPAPGDFVARLTGRTIRRLGRHGKFLLAHLDGDVMWVTHLGMSGRVAVAAQGEPEAPHTNVVVRLDSDREFRLVDPRTFGFVAAWLPGDPQLEGLAALGPDALDAMPTRRDLVALLAGRTAPIKPLLLDQRLLAGLGNIYADEALHRAGIDPHRPAGALTSDEVGRLRTGIRQTLRAGLRHGGTSLDDLAYLLPDGQAGEYLSRLRVYGREGEDCPRCGNAIRRDVLRQRSTFWCDSCQS